MRPTSPADIGLTERQIELLALMMRGNSHGVLDAANRTEAVIAARAFGSELPRVPH